jgi:hypothetical protein
MATTDVQAMPGLWREAGGLAGLVRLEIPALTAGMVVVAKAGEPWQTRPELRWQVWPDRLAPDVADDSARPRDEPVP